MKVASTKYEVATSIITIFMQENVYMHQIVFTTTIEHKENHLDEVQAGSGATTHREDICVIECFCYTVLYGL